MFVDVIAALQDYGINITIYDPWANPTEVQHEYKLNTVNTLPKETFDSVVLGVAHNEFLDLDLDALRNEHSILYDVKGVLGKNVDGNL